MESKARLANFAEGQAYPGDDRTETRGIEPAAFGARAA